MFQALLKSYISKLARLSSIYITCEDQEGEISPMVRLYFGLYGRSCIGSVVSQLNFSSGCMGGKSSLATTVSLRVVPEDFYNYILNLLKQRRHRGHSVADILVRLTWIGTIS